MWISKDKLVNLGTQKPQETHVEVERVCVRARRQEEGEEQEEKEDTHNNN